MPRKLVLVAVGAILLTSSLAAAGAVVGASAPRWLGSALEEARAEVEELEMTLAEREARIDELRATGADLRATIVELQGQVVEQERTIAHLENALGESGPISEQYATMASEYGTLRAEHEKLQRELASLVRIRTPELTGDALLLDRSVQGVSYSGAVCSGSMEPNITCNDLLLLYEPKVTDLRVGDVIYFRRQAPDCSGPLEGRFILHRITRVTANAEGLWFQTKGDALTRDDPCPVPAEDVLYKLLANVRNARIQN